jgi:N utilization substance protein A
MGKNARLAAKLTGWRIDIKSLPESISDWLFALKNKEELKELVKEEAESITQAEDIMARKADGRVINPEEYDFLAKLNDRLERFAARKYQAEYEKQSQIRDKIMKTIPSAAFEMDLSGIGLPIDLVNTLVEAGFDNAGKLILASKMNPESLTAIEGVNQKILDKIAEFTEVLPELIHEEQAAQAEEAAAAAPIEETVAPVEAGQTEAEVKAVETAEAQPEEAVEEKEAEEKPRAVKRYRSTRCSRSSLKHSPVKEKPATKRKKKSLTRTAWLQARRKRRRK